MPGKNRHWLPQYFMFQWLYNNEKFELISSFDSNNYFLNREANSFKYKSIQDSTYTDCFIKSLLKNRDCLVALHGLYLFPFIPEESDSDLSEYNDYIRHIVSSDMIDYISHILRSSFSISAPDIFFSQKVWLDVKAYEELNMSFRLFFEYRSTDPSKSLLNLNIFNNLVYDKICEILSISKPAKEYGVNLDSGCIEDYLPIANRYFTEINKQRNQRTEAHPYDKYGKVRIRINVSELEKLIKKQKKALEEICSFNFFESR